MKKYFSPFSCFLLLFLLLSSASCGYKFASDFPTVMGDRNKTLKVKGVDHPTLLPWLPYAIRTKLRDEINARHIAQWVDSGSADYEIQINVQYFKTSEWMSSAENVGLLFDTTLSLEGILYKSDTNTILWRSGPIIYSDRSEGIIGRQAADDIIKETMIRLADLMQNSF